MSKESSELPDVSPCSLVMLQNQNRISSRFSSAQAKQFSLNVHPGQATTAATAPTAAATTTTQTAAGAGRAEELRGE